jgi:hypothetical protein
MNGNSRRNFPYESRNLYDTIVLRLLPYALVPNFKQMRRKPPWLTTTTTQQTTKL